MNHIEFIEKNVMEALIKQGFPVSVAQGGRGKPLTYIEECHRQVVKAVSTMMSLDMLNFGQINKFQNPLLLGIRNNLSLLKARFFEYSARCSALITRRN